MSGDPFCGNCGYQLTGLTESSKCPECGKPLVEVLRREKTQPFGRRYRSPIRVFGLPLVDIAVGPHMNERLGRARGIFAYGDIAIGLIAVGNIAAIGIVALGGSAAVGVLALGAATAGLLAAGGLAVGGFALGGFAAGLIALGGMAVGGLALGGAAYGHTVAGGSAWGVHVISGLKRDPTAVATLNDYAWLIGTFPPTATSMLVPLLWFAAAGIVLLALIGAIALLGRQLGQTERR